MINVKENDNMTTKYKSATQHCIAIMNEMKDQPMADVVKAMTNRVRNRKGDKFSVGEARTAYNYLVKNEKAPGKIEKLVVAKAPKAPKAPKAKAAPKAPVDRKEVLKAAAKKAGIHRETVADAVTAVETASENDDPLNLGAPEALSMDDLKEIL